MLRRRLTPFAIFLVCSSVYVALLGTRAEQPSANNHYVYLAQSFLAGQLDVVGNRPPGSNDWAYYQGHWYVSFPPFPALVILPAVAIWGTATRDALFWAILAGAAPALLFVLLRTLSERFGSARSPRENLTLTALFAFGTVFFFVAVQGTVWFAAQVVASNLIILFLLFGLGARFPLLAGCALGATALTRPPTLLLSLWFALEALHTHRRAYTVDTNSDRAHPLMATLRWLRGAHWPRALRAIALCALPAVCAVGIQFWLNAARWNDPFVSGHEYLQIAWRNRIETWGLFNYHFLPKNLAVFVAGLPWFLDSAPYVKVSLHGLALWYTTPNLFWLLWPARIDPRMVSLYGAALTVAIMNLCYQNSGWIQFGYRFALDYMPLLFTLLALGRRRFGPVFALCMVFAIAVNAFGAVTFDRAWEFYDDDWSQNRLFQPD